MDFRKQHDGQRLEIFLGGRLAFEDNESFRQVVDDVAQPGLTQCVVHLRDLDEIDAAGLGMLILARNAAERVGASLSLSGPQGQVADLLHISRFHELVPLDA